eukprot:6404235-Pyramimonas_sp.AAC.1
MTNATLTYQVSVEEGGGGDVKSVGGVGTPAVGASVVHDCANVGRQRLRTAPTLGSETYEGRSWAPGPLRGRLCIP